MIDILFYHVKNFIQMNLKIKTKIANLCRYIVLFYVKNITKKYFNTGLRYDNFQGYFLNLAIFCIAEKCSLSTTFGRK